MTLTLSVLRCPDGVPPETRRIEGGEFAIGRGLESDWVLPDPERVMSKRHCLLTFQNGVWQVADTSTNGTFLNQETQRLGRDAPRVLRDGDRLIVGAYEIEAILADRAAATAPSAEPSTGFTEDRIAGDPFPALETDPLGVVMQPLGVLLGDAPIGAERDRLEPALPRSDHTPMLQESYRAPRSSLELLPADWDRGASIMPPRAVTLPPEPVQPAPVEPPVTADAAVPAPSDAGSTGAALAMLLAGAGIDGTPSGEPAGVLRGLGQALRAMVVGLRRLMIARAAVKGEFRIEQTMIRAVRNNPLKFSASDEDALAAMLSIGRRSGMSAAEAVTDALRQMRLHELATASAMQQAVRDMLAELEPERVMSRLAPESLDNLPGRRKARGWDAYEALHGKTLQALADDFDSVFGKSFARAYERAMAEIALQDAD